MTSTHAELRFAKPAPEQKPINVRRKYDDYASMNCIAITLHHRLERCWPR